MTCKLKVETGPWSTIVSNSKLALCDISSDCRNVLFIKTVIKDMLVNCL